VRNVSRRDLLKYGLAGAGVAALPIGELIRSAGAGSGNSEAPNSPAVARFVRDLAIPPLARPVGTHLWEDGTTVVPYYEITQSITNLRVLDGLSTPFYTYNGVSPGPTFRVKRGEKIVVRQINRLPVATSTHLHGARVKGRYDGHPVRGLVPPGGDRLYFYPNEQDAIPMWYHDHAIENTGHNVFMGLAAHYFLTDDHEISLNLPTGRFDIPLTLQDKGFNADGTIHFARKNGDPLRQGEFGDVILVNGVPYPKLTVERRKYRFRILNGSNARFYSLRLSTGDGFSVVDSDGGLLKNRVDIDELWIPQAHRYGIVVDFSKYRAGQRVILENTVAPDPFGDPVDPEKVKQVMAFDVVEASGPDTSSLPVALSSWPPPGVDPKRSVRTRVFEFDRANGMWTINNRPFDDNRFDAEPALGSTEIWRLVNRSGAWLHPVHMHLVEFAMLNRNGGPVRPYEVGPKDVVSLGPNETVDCALWFDGDEDFRNEVYVMHCHNLEHEDNDMMINWRVV